MSRRNKEKRHSGIGRIIRGLIICVAVICIIGIFFGKDDSSDDSNFSPTEKTVEKPIEQQHLQCGESARFDKVIVQVENPVGPLVKTTFESPSSYTEYEALIKAPITIQASDSVIICAEDFKSKVIEEDENCLPRELGLERGETFEGFLYIKWPYAYMDSGEGEYPKKIECNSDYCKATWDITYKGKTIKVKKAEDIYKQLPRTKIETNVKVNTLYPIGGSDDCMAFFECSNPNVQMFGRIPSEKVDEFERYEGSINEKPRTIRIKGMLTNMTTMTTGTEGREKNSPYLKNVRIVAK